MDYPSPTIDLITIYSKSGCTYCKKAKSFLTSINKPFCMIDCDEFLLDNKADFLLFIKNLSNMDVTSFPIIFNGDTFIGGYNELVSAIHKNNAINTNDLNNAVTTAVDTTTTDLLFDESF
jgi:glutaredoxin